PKNGARSTIGSPHRLGARAKAGDDVVAMREEEVAVARMRKPRRCDERAAAQAPMRAEPRLRIIAIPVGDETWIRCKRVRSPFPDRTAPFDRVKCRRAFPFRFGGQAPTGEATERLRLVGVDMTGRRIGAHRLPRSEPPMLPAVATLAPALRAVDARFAQPGAAFLGPPLRRPVPARIDEVGVFGVAHAARRDTVWSKRAGMRPFLVVE